MYTSQLLLVLKSLSKKELSQFDLFLHSPYFHKRKLRPEVLNLWKYLQRGLQHKGERYFERQRVYGVLFPQQEIIKSKLEKLMSQLLSLAKAFLVQQQSEQGIGEKTTQVHLLTAYFDKQLHTPFQQLYRKIQAAPEAESKHWERSYFYEQFLLQSKISQFQSHYNNRKSDLNLPNTHFSLDLYYLVQKFEYSLQMLARNMFVFQINSPESLQLIDAIIPALSARHLQVPLIQLYLSAYRLLQSFYEEKGEQQLTEFNHLLSEYADDITHEQLKNLQTLNRNYYLNKYLQGDTLYLQRVFKLYQEHLKRGFLYEEEQIFPGMLSNVVLLGLRNKAFDWVYQFLLEHQHRIGGTLSPEFVFQYNLGEYYFATQDYQGALDHIAATYEDQFYKVAARRLEVKILYEMDSEIFDDKLKAFKLFIYRLTKNSAHFENKKGNQHFVDLLKQIRHPKTFKNQSRIDKLLEKARQSKSKYLADKEWIIAKLIAKQ